MLGAPELYAEVLASSYSVKLDLSKIVSRTSNVIRF